MIRIEHPDKAEIEKSGIKQCPIWEHGEPVHIRAGDLVTFPAGMSCRWNITSPVRKHYRFG